MEGAEGLNIARVASMQEHAGQGDDGSNIAILSDLSPVNMKGLNILASTSGNIEQGYNQIAEQTKTLSFIQNLAGGGKPTSIFGIKIFQEQHFNFTSMDESIGISNTEEPLGGPQGGFDESIDHGFDPGEALHSSGTLLDGSADFNNIAPPSHTPPMEDHHRGDEIAVGG